VAGNPFERPGRDFRSAVEKISHRFRGKIQRAAKQMQTAEAAMERAKADIERAKEEFEAEMGRVRAELEADLKRARTEWAEMDPEEAGRALRELKQARDELRAKRAAAPRGARGARQIRSAQEHVQRLIERAVNLPPKRRRPRRDLDDGGLPAPVKPRPNPTPLVDGAEAPIE
jgi:DNA repair exonuclease SbcCD ATPase subunit